jgi:hypothetical protein
MIRSAVAIATETAVKIFEQNEPLSYTTNYGSHGLLHRGGRSSEPQSESTVKPYGRLIPLCAKSRNRVFLAIDGVAASTQSVLVTVCMMLLPCA